MTTSKTKHFEFLKLETNVNLVNIITDEMFDNEGFFDFVNEDDKKKMPS